MPVTTGVHIRIEGRVQGVGYRAWMRDNAAELGLAGWVRNCSDGSVEAVIRGRRPAVLEMMHRCATGPTYAVVSKVTIIAEDCTAPEGFQVRR